MPLKTILVHLETEAQALAVTQVAIGLAKTHAAHLIGLHVVPDPFISAAVPPEVVGELLDAQRNANLAGAKRIGETFNVALAQANVPFEWQAIEAHFESAASIVIRQGNAADLVVLGQPDRSINLIEGIATPEEVMLGLGRPVVIVPNKPSVTTIGQRVLLGWNGNRESARAAFDALPFLQKAESVRLLAAGRPHGAHWGGIRDDAAPTGAIVAALARHGVRASVATTEAGPAEVASALLAQAKEHRSDLVVMGGYGHWRMREIVFGGATHGILEHATIPVLMSH